MRHMLSTATRFKPFPPEKLVRNRGRRRISAQDRTMTTDPNYTEVKMSASIFAKPGKSDYRVLWEEADGYTRERRFDAYRAAQRFARQVDCRLHMETLAENTARCGRGATPR